MKNVEQVTFDHISLGGILFSEILWKKQRMLN